MPIFFAPKIGPSLVPLIKGFLSIFTMSETSYLSYIQGSVGLLSLEQQVKLSWIELSYLSSNHRTDGLLDLI
jgi:hypothetical protein